MRFGGEKLPKLSLGIHGVGLLVCALLLGAAVRAEDCGNGVKLTLNAPEAAQGTLLLAQIRSARPLGEISGRWNERDVPFWLERGKEHSTSSADVRKALIGVDL